MKSLRHPLFITCTLLFCLNRLLEQMQIYIWPLYAYLDDLLSMPLTLGLILAVQRAYFKDLTMTVPVAHVVFAVATFAIFFEFLLPLYREAYTADMLDVIAYAVGALAFHLLMNKPLKVPAAAE